MEALSLVGRVLAVFLLLGVTLWLLRRTDARSRGRRGAPLQVLGSARLSRGASVTVVRIGGEDVVLGVTEHNVTLLGPAGVTEAPDAEAPVAATAAPAGAAVAGSARASAPASPGAGPASEGAPAAPAPAPAGPAPSGPVDFRSALTAELQRAGALPGTPPTTGQFLRSAYRAARSRPTGGTSTDVSPAAVQAALSSVRGDRPDAAAQAVDRPATAAVDRAGQTVDRTEQTAEQRAEKTAEQTAEQGVPAAPPAGVALRRAVTRSRARRGQPVRLHPAASPGGRAGRPADRLTG